MARIGQATIILQKILSVRKNHARGPWIFTYEPLNFWENMFVVHDLTYEPLYCRENMFAVHNFPKKDLKLCNNSPENATVYEFLRMNS
jgi:hypothetical protein